MEGAGPGEGRRVGVVVLKGFDLELEVLRARDDDGAADSSSSFLRPLSLRLLLRRKRLRDGILVRVEFFGFLDERLEKEEDGG